MNRRGFLASLLALPAAAIAVLRPHGIQLIADDVVWNPIVSPDYSAKPFLEHHRKEIEKIFRVSVRRDLDDGRWTIESFEGTEAEIAEFRRKWIEEWMETDSALDRVDRCGSI